MSTEPAVSAAPAVPKEPVSTLPVPVSLLDRSRTRDGEPAGAALGATLDRARRAEELGFHRFWVAEHHSVPGIASGSPPLLMAAVAAQTSRIRVGSGGVMLPNHRPLIVAEQARMLAALYPGRIDLGIGRSLGFTAPVRDALGVTSYGAEQFAEDLAMLQAFLQDAGPVTAMPSSVDSPPIFVLATGSGLAVAADHGLPVVIGGSLVQGDLAPVQEYRKRFQPSSSCSEPLIVVSADVMVAATSERAQELMMSEAWAMVESRSTGAFPPLRNGPPPRLTDRQQVMIERHLAQAVYGTAEQVAAGLTDLVRRTGAAEVIAFSSTYDRSALDASDVALAQLQPSIDR